MRPDTTDDRFRAFRELCREAVLRALDDVAAREGSGKAEDADLPELFRAIDTLADRMWMRSA